MNAPSIIAGLGARTDHIAAVPNVDAASLRLSSEESALLKLVGQGSRIDQVLSRSSLGEARSIAVLLSLRLKGAIAPISAEQAAGAASRSPPAPTPAPVAQGPRVQRGAPLTPAMEAALAEAVDLEPARKRDLVEMDRLVEAGADFFTLLGLKPGATTEDARRAYYEASRRYHPDRFYGKNLGSYRARVDRIFRRLTEAHTTLTHPERRAAYLQAHPYLAAPPEPERAPPSPEELERQVERQARLARHPYFMRAHRLPTLLASAKAAIAQGEFEHALSELQKAAQVEPKNREVTALVAEARRRRDQERSRRELERGHALEREGNRVGAQMAYKVASSLDPQNAEAAYRAAQLGYALGQEVSELRTLALRAVESAPDKAPHQLLLAHLYIQTGARKLARKHLEEALKLEPKNAEAQALLKKIGWSLLDLFKPHD